LNEICRETSTRDTGHMYIAYLTMFLIVGMLCYDVNNMLSHGIFKPIMLGLEFLWIVLWIWKVMVRYEAILRENELEIVSILFGMRRSIKFDLTKTESFSDRYVRSFFRRTRISKYYHRFSMVDPEVKRIIAFNNGKRLEALLFCCSDHFLKEMIKVMPDKYIGLAQD